MSKSIVEIQGFEELQQKIKRLPDKIKRRELLKIYGQVANPTLKAARSFAAVGKRKHTKDAAGPGNLKRSIKKRIGKKGDEKINAVVYVGPSLKGKYKGWYGHFLEGGTKNMPAKPFMQPAYNQTKGQITKDAEVKTAKYIQKQINRLSNV